MTEKILEIVETGFEHSTVENSYYSQNMDGFRIVTDKQEISELINKKQFLNKLQRKLPNKGNRPIMNKI